jgi:NAD(P)-dependent dehydrogenase (short-subunit alcohol dehydrogenase family)
VKIAVVTGAAGSIGAAVCARLAAREYHVVAVDVDTAGLDRLGGPVTRLPLDLTQLGFHDAVVTTVDQLGGRCDVLVNNAGIVVTTPFQQVTAAEAHREQLINLHAPMHLSRALYPHLQVAGGHILTVVSLAAMMPLRESAGYCASKAGLRAFMLALALHARHTGVHISMIHPGAVDTPMLRHEAATGGSALNFLSEPLDPHVVAETVTSLLKHPRLETSLPRYDGWLLKLVALAPGVLPRALPLLERAAQTRLEKYRQRSGIR